MDAAQSGLTLHVPVIPGTSGLPDRKPGGGFK